jgi:hypothetical protein
MEHFRFHLLWSLEIHKDQFTALIFNTIINGMRFYSWFNNLFVWILCRTYSIDMHKGLQSWLYCPLQGDLYYFDITGDSWDQSFHHTVVIISVYSIYFPWCLFQLSHKTFYTLHATLFLLHTCLSTECYQQCLGRTEHLYIVCKVQMAL